MQPSVSVSVSSLDTFRYWKDEDDLGLDWLLARLEGGEQTPAMALGSAFHSAIENAPAGEVEILTHGSYRFNINCDAEIVLPSLAEAAVQQQYGDLLVRGRVDALIGREVTDYKTTQQFDPDRLMSGYQWRYYLDMTECDTFCWQVFELREVDPLEYDIRAVHTLRQNRYPELHADCQKLAAEFVSFAHSIGWEGRGKVSAGTSP